MSCCNNFLLGRADRRSYTLTMFMAVAVEGVAIANGQEANLSGPLMGTPGTTSSSNPPTAVAHARDQKSHWFLRVGVADATYHSGATIASNGTVIPGATVTVSNNVALALDIGYQITKNFSAVLMLGNPPKPTITGQGTVSAFGELGAVRYGPVVLSALYHPRPDSAFQPYAGLGVAYAIVLKDYDAAISDLHVDNNFGFVCQAGAEYKLNTQWSLVGDFKYVWLSVNANGSLGGAVPVTARVKLDPSLVTVGIKYQF